MFPESSKDENGVYRLINDDFLIKFDDTQADSVQVIKGVGLNVTNLENSMSFWQMVGLDKVNDESLKCPDFDFFTLYLNQVESIERGKAFGRLAISCHDDDI
jgi:hypothetical protein